MIEWIIFAAASIFFIAISGRSLLDPRAHGFYRFFAFEAATGLVLLNIRRWFADPFSPLQIISWVLLSASLFMVIHSIYLLRAVGRPRDAIEDTTVLVRRGAYRFIRHPLYSSLLYFGWGAFFKGPGFLTGALAVLLTAALVATAKVEERENQRKFGGAYAAYMRETRMFIPYLF